MRKLGVVPVCVAAAFALAPAALADGKEGSWQSPPKASRTSEDGGGLASASLTCERVDAPGRVRCDVEAKVGAGESIAWGDIVIARTPPFLGALRGRIGPDDATVRQGDTWRWAFALVARAKGSGDVEARVRLVVCRGDRCEPHEVVVVAQVVVGG